MMATRNRRMIDRLTDRQLWGLLLTELDQLASRGGDFTRLQRVNKARNAQELAHELRDRGQQLQLGISQQVAGNHPINRPVRGEDEILPGVHDLTAAPLSDLGL